MRAASLKKVSKSKTDTGRKEREDGNPLEGITPRPPGGRRVETGSRCEPVWGQKKRRGVVIMKSEKSTE